MYTPIPPVLLGLIIQRTTQNPGAAPRVQRSMDPCSTTLSEDPRIDSDHTAPIKDSFI